MPTRLAAILGLCLASSTDVFAFQLPLPKSVSSALHLFVDLKSNGEFSQEVIQSSQKNEWGIPDSRTLDPFRSIPADQLDNGGRMTLVGSGPGDPDLLTVKALRLLQDPNALVICDRLVSDEIRELIQGELQVARKLPGCADLAQEEIYWWAYQGLKAGRHVIRLKIGDPFVFGRGGEEVLTFRRFGVEPTVIPVSRNLLTRRDEKSSYCALSSHNVFLQGVSAAFSAPLLGNIPVTHRGVSNQVVMCTGYGREGTSPDLIQYHKEQTVVFLMAVGRLRELCGRLVSLAGYPEDTPVGIVERAGCPNQRTVVGNMKTIGDIAEEHNVQAPSTIIVGDVVNVLLDKDEKGEAARGLIQNATESVAV